MKTKFLAIIALAVCTVFGCTKDGKEGIKSLIDIVPEVKGVNCSSGGIKVMTGMDINNNNILDANEVQNSEFICNGINGINGINGTDGEDDKQIRIYFPANGYSYTTTSTTGQVDSLEIIKGFDITSYQNADSIVFGSYLQTTDVTVRCTVELYNCTTNTVISNTALISNSLITWGWESTNKNFIENLPKSPINLGIRVKSQSADVSVLYYLPMIIIYRK